MNSKNARRVGYPAQLILIASKTPYKASWNYVEKDDQIQLLAEQNKSSTHTTPQLLHYVNILENGRF